MNESMRELLKRLTDKEVLKGLLFGVIAVAMFIGFYILFTLLEGGVYA